MTPIVYDFVSKVANEIGRQRRVLEVGSRDVNGSVRSLFVDAEEYIGIDALPGLGVDFLWNAHDIRRAFRRGSFDCVICCEMLEHDPKFWVTVANMRWVLRIGGWMIITVPSLLVPRHDHPLDYYRFLTPAIEEMFRDFEDVQVVEAFEYGPHEDEPKALFGYGRKPGGRT